MREDLLKQIQNQNTYKVTRPAEGTGMDLRDYFAGRALIGLSQRDRLKAGDMARLAYECADKMMEERQKGIQDNENVDKA